MTQYDSNSLELARKAIEDMLDRSVKAQAKFRPGTSQHSLQVNRIKALNISLALLSTETAKTIHSRFSTQELYSAIAPLMSLIRKSEKARTHLQPDSWQHTMLTSNLMGLNLALETLRDVIDINQLQE